MASFVLLAAGMETLRPVPWLFACLLFACGGATTGAGTDASVDHATDGASGDASADVAPDAPGGPCPASAPATGAPCSLPDGYQCEYGTSFWAFCDLLATCSGGHWSVPSTQACPFTEGGGACPSQSPTNGAACSPENITCGYPDEQCNCEGFCGGPFMPDAGVDWKCTPRDPNCPWPRPRLGSPCSVSPDAGLYCRYDICCVGTDIECLSGTWQGSTSSAGCP